MIACWLLLACTEPGPLPYRPHAERRAALDVPAEGFFSAEGYQVLSRPLAGQWLAEHDEPGQDVATFRTEQVAPGPGEALLLVPVGELEADLTMLAEVAGSWLGLPVEVQDLGLDLAGLDGRLHPATGAPQVFTGPLLSRLHGALPAGAFAALAVTETDLTPGMDWNFVFGQASYTERVGVFSFARHHRGATTAVQATRRALRTLTHEAAHMMGLRHCPYYACALNGSNSLSESDAAPLHLCPICLRKLQLATGVDLATRYDALARHYQRMGLAADAALVRSRRQAAAR